MTHGDADGADASGGGIWNKMKARGFPTPRFRLGYPACQGGVSPCAVIGSPACTAASGSQTDVKAR